MTRGMDLSPCNRCTAIEYSFNRDFRNVGSRGYARARIDRFLSFKMFKVIFSRKTSLDSSHSARNTSVFILKTNSDWPLTARFELAASSRKTFDRGPWRRLMFAVFKLKCLDKKIKRTKTTQRSERFREHTSSWRRANVRAKARHRPTNLLRCKYAATSVAGRWERKRLRIVQNPRTTATTVSE